MPIFDVPAVTWLYWGLIVLSALTLLLFLYVPIRYLVNFILKRKGKRLKLKQNLLSSMKNLKQTLKEVWLIDLFFRKSLFSDFRIEMAVREAIGKQKGQILESDLEGLTKLNADGRGVTDLSGIEYCINLQKLYLGSNQLKDISLLSNLTKLQELTLTNGGIRHISPLSNLTKLQRLRLGSNLISDITPLNKLINLQELYLWYNQISNIRPLRHLTNLQRLGLESNKIKDISSLGSLANLQELTLTDNWIIDISFLSNLTKLKRVYLAKNQIRNISPLVNNTGIGEGDEVDLKGNPLNDEAYEVHIPALQKRGVKVQFDPKS